jgi:signal transduction histidine kinase/ActR/RegA family two-component response regulator
MKDIPYLYIIIFLLGCILFFMSGIGYFAGGFNILLPVFLISTVLQFCIVGLLSYEKRNAGKIKKICDEFEMPYLDTDTTLDVFRKLASEFYKLNQFIIDTLPSAGRNVIESKDVIQKIFSVISSNVPAEAINIRLFEDMSGVSARNYLLGCPKWMREEKDSEMYKEYVVSGYLYFSGKKFGLLEIETSVPISQLVSIDKSIFLLTSYASLLFVNAEFQLELARIQRVSGDSAQIKTGFLATLSHEIRGPLGVIMNSVELVMDGLCGEVTQEGKEALAMVQESSRHLMDLVNDVLDFARIESGLIEADPAAISVEDLLNDMSAVVRSQAIGKRQKLVVERPDSRLAVVCDKRHIRQILINILTNAIKYTPDGGTITLSAHHITAERVKISVSDTGVGIPEDEFHKVFGAFMRVDDEYSKHQQGTGLGMPLTKKLVEVNKGSVGFSSEPGMGSTFWVELPLSYIEPMDTEEHDGEVIIFGNGEKVLLVEPDEEQRSVYSRSLDQRGFSVTTATTATEVLKEIRSQEFAAVVIETDLPDLCGEQLIQSIRSTPGGSRVPLIIMSGKAFVFDLERFIRLGVDRCLSKPFSLVELAATVKKLIDEIAFLDQEVDVSGENAESLY